MAAARSLPAIANRSDAPIAFGIYNPATPPKASLFLTSSIRPGWLLLQPILASLEIEEDGYCIISDNEFAVYGTGESPQEALEDYRVSLIDYYMLVAARSETHPPTQPLFDHLREYLLPLSDDRWTGYASKSYRIGEASSEEVSFYPSIGT